MKLFGKFPSHRWCWKQMDLFSPPIHFAVNEMNHLIWLFTAHKIAELRGIDMEQVSRQTTANAENLFKFKQRCDITTMIAENIQKIKEKIAKAAVKANRSPDTIKLVAVSKRFPVAKINEAYAAGQIIFGENYIQEVQLKERQVPSSVIFHFIGHLQSNKAKIAAATCDMIETVDGMKLGKALNNHLQVSGQDHGCACPGKYRQRSAKIWREKQ